MENQTQLSECYGKKMGQQLMQQQINQYEKRAHSIGISIWHFEWCTKYRYRMFQKEKYANLIAACIRQAAHKHGMKIVALAIEPEHVHCEVELTLAMSPAKALNLLKGYSAYVFFRHHEKARLGYPKGHLWSAGKFAASVGFIQRDVVTAYVRGQREHHGNSTL